MAEFKSKADAQRKLKSAREDLVKKADKLRGFTAEVMNTRAKLAKNPGDEKLKKSLKEALDDQDKAQTAKKEAIAKCASIQLVIDRWF